MAEIPHRDAHSSLSAVWNWVMSFAFLAIDGTAGCAVLQASGSLLMAVMGIVAAQAKAVTKEEAIALLARPVTEFYDKKKKK